MEGMVCPIPLPKPSSNAEFNLVDSVLSEAEQLAPWQSLFRNTHNRSSVGVCELPMPDAIRFLGLLLNNTNTGTVSNPDVAKKLRFASEDLRNFYLEAAIMRPGGPASKNQLADWFWGDTSAGALLLALHTACKTSDNIDLRQVAADQLVPRAQRHRLNSM